MNMITAINLEGTGTKIEKLNCNEHKFNKINSAQWTKKYVT